MTTLFNRLSGPRLVCALNWDLAFYGTAIAAALALGSYVATL
ncbi:hypothetical protein SAMN05444413_103116 [Roseivivax marinus]|jgi:hypothetical protein|nr:hypothetical protein [Roseivivax marinus]SEK73430.1 hypothetical protein SAMN05444413_103116 [Roseivivax marinus]